MSSTGALSYADPALTDDIRQEGDVLNARMRKYGIGMYRNEASPLPVTWENDYWGPNHLRLLSIKHAWDPHNVFTCFDCVGRR